MRSEDAALTASDVRPAPLWEDFVDVFYAPGRVFARRRHSGFGLPLLVLTVLSVASFAAVRPLLQPLLDRAFAAGMEQMARQPGVTAEQLEQTRAMTERFSGIGVWTSAVVGTPVFVLLVALLLWGAARILGLSMDLRQAGVVATYANVPRVLTGVLGALVLLVVDPATLPVLPGAPFGPVLLLGPDASPIVTALLGRLDLGALWVTALLGVGVAVMARAPRGRGFAAAAIVWVVATLFAVLNAARTMAAMSG